MSSGNTSTPSLQNYYPSVKRNQSDSMGSESSNSKTTLKATSEAVEVGAPQQSPSKATDEYIPDQEKQSAIAVTARLQLVESHKPNFDTLCRQLNLDKATIDEAWKILHRAYWRHYNVNKDALKDDEEAAWHIFAIWIAGRVEARPNGVTLNQLIGPHLKVEEFFAKLKRFSQSNPDLPTGIATHLQHVENDYNILVICYKTWKSLSHILFPAQEEMILSRICWYLFLVAKEQLLIRGKQTVVNAAELLCCCIIYAMYCNIRTRSKAEIRQKAIEANLIDKNALPMTGDGSMKMEDLKLMLCKIIRVDFHQTETLYNGLFVRFLEKLKTENQRLHFNGSAKSSDTVTGLFNSHIIYSNTKELGNIYESLLKQHSGECDGRFERENIETPRKTLSSARTPHKSPATRSLHAHLESFSYQPMPMTPLTARGIGPILSQIENERHYVVERIRNCLADALMEPSPTLTEYMKNASPTLYDTVKNHAAEIIERAKNETTTKDYEYWDLAHKLYYQTLEAMLKREEKRIPKSFAILLNNESFQYSLLACCLEVIRYTFEISIAPEKIICLFSKVKPFEFLMIIESFIKEQQHFGRPMVKRLKEIEERILESEAWKDEDPLYNSLKAEATPAKDVPFSPRKALTVITQTNDPAVPEVKKPRCTKLEFFYRKLYRLVHSRLLNLTEALKIDSSTVQKIWDLIVFLLSKEDSLRLIYNRHIDQILLCCIYGVWKIFGKSGNSFAEIIGQYKNQPQYVEKTITKVPHPEKGDCGIITFYNEVFLDKVHKYLESMCPDTSNSKGILGSMGPPPLIPHAPMPATKTDLVPMSPRAPIYLNPKSDHLLNSPGSPYSPYSLSYRFPDPSMMSPSKEMAKLNRVISSQKKLTFTEATDSPTKRARILSSGSESGAGTAEPTDIADLMSLDKLHNQNHSSSDNSDIQ